MTRETWRGVGAGAAIGGVGLLLYLLAKNLGGGGDSARGGGVAPSPPHPRDAQPLAVVVQPSPTDPMKAVIKLEDRVVSVGELVSRISAGGRSDVRVTVTGDTRQGAWSEIREALEFLGVKILLRQPSGNAQVSGNARGQYGTRWSIP